MKIQFTGMCVELDMLEMMNMIETLPEIQRRGMDKSKIVKIEPYKENHQPFVRFYLKPLEDPII